MRSIEELIKTYAESDQTKEERSLLIQATRNHAEAVTMFLVDKLQHPPLIAMVLAHSVASLLHKSKGIDFDQRYMAFQDLLGTFMNEINPKIQVKVYNETATEST